MRYQWLLAVRPSGSRKVYRVTGRFDTQAAAFAWLAQFGTLGKADDVRVERVKRNTYQRA